MTLVEQFLNSLNSLVRNFQINDKIVKFCKLRPKIDSLLAQLVNSVRHVNQKDVLCCTQRIQTYIDVAEFVQCFTYALLYTCQLFVLSLDAGSKLFSHPCFVRLETILNR